MELTPNDITERIHAKEYAALKALLNEENAVEIAALFSEIPTDVLPLAFRLLSKELAAETFVEMDSDSQELLIRSFSDRELQGVVEELYNSSPRGCGRIVL